MCAQWYAPMRKGFPFRLTAFCNWIGSPILQCSYGDFMRRILFLTASIFAFSATSLHAEEANTNETIVVSATKTPKKISEIGSSLVVIDAEKIRNMQPVQLVDILQSVPNISFDRSGGTGALTNVHIRGAEAEYTQIIYDGVKMVDAASVAGGFDFGTLVMGDIERIEVLQGPQSSLYGSDAIGGVISIFSKQPRKPLEANLNLEAGSLNTFLGRAGVSGYINNLTYSLAGLYLQTDNISNTNEWLGGVEKDGYTNIGFSGRVKYDLTENLSLDIRGLYSKADNSLDSSSWAPPYLPIDSGLTSLTTQNSLYIGLNTNNFDGKLSQQISYKYYETKREYEDPDIWADPAYYSYFGIVEAIDYQGEIKFSPQFSVVFGGGNEQTSYKNYYPASWSGSPYDIQNTSIYNIFADAHANPFKGLNLTFGIRYDNHEKFGDNIGVRSTISYTPNDGNTIIRASYGEGFKAPTLYQLYNSYGNPYLIPEMAKAYDFGLTQKLSENWQLGASYFHSDIENKIEWLSVPPYWPENLAKTETEGYEFDLKGKIQNLNLDFGYSNIDARNTTIGDANYGKTLRRRPREKFDATASYIFSPSLNGSLSWDHYGKSYDDKANTYVLASYDLLALRLNWDVNDDFTLYGRVENLSDENYETAYGYGTSPRTFTIGLRAKF